MIPSLIIGLLALLGLLKLLGIPILTIFGQGGDEEEKVDMVFQPVDMVNQPLDMDVLIPVEVARHMNELFQISRHKLHSYRNQNSIHKAITTTTLPVDQLLEMGTKLGSLPKKQN